MNYLSYLNKIFDGNWLHALAAYNSGSGRVRSAIKRNQSKNKSTDFWSLDLPRETRAYVPKLIALDKDNNVLNTWGPRPTVATKMVADYKAKHGALDANFKQDLQVWYNKDKGESTQDDFVKLAQ